MKLCIGCGDGAVGGDGFSGSDLSPTTTIGHRTDMDTPAQVPIKSRSMRCWDVQNHLLMTRYLKTTLEYRRSRCVKYLQAIESTIWQLKNANVVLERSWRKGVQTTVSIVRGTLVRHTMRILRECWGGSHVN